MSFFTTNFPRTGPALSIAALLLLTACVQAKPSIDAAYSDRYSRNMFETGYSFISDHYINTVSLRDLSLSGLDGLRQIDAKLDVRSTARQIEVLYLSLIHI